MYTDVFAAWEKSNYIYQEKIGALSVHVGNAIYFVLKCKSFIFILHLYNKRRKSYLWKTEGRRNYRSHACIFSLYMHSRQLYSGVGREGGRGGDN